MPTTWEERFRRSVRVDDETGCHVWTGSLSSGYGRIRRGGVKEFVHRVAWEVAHGPVPEGLMVRHRVCDNRACVNVAHLEVGTHADNMRDMVEHGRAAKGDKIFLHRHPEKAPRPGSRNGMAKLTDEQVVEMRALRQQGVKLAVLSDRFKVAKSAVSNICNNKRWRSLGEAPAA